MKNNAKDPIWSDLISASRDIIKPDETEAAYWLEGIEGAEGRPHGCTIFAHHSSFSKHWRAKLHLGSETRCVGVGDIFQCAVLHDCALYFFREYRTRPKHDAFRYNYSEEKAKQRLHASKELRKYFRSLESYLLDNGQLTPREEKQAYSKLMVRLGNRRRQKSFRLRKKTNQPIIEL